ncbi:MAG TPA: Ppx/GppA family phosphatase [Nitrospirae bacterium]|nr:Ppx/GppA family phosphatase [Nitrospirota bacterium]
MGTNTFRLLIAEVQPDSFQNSYSIKEFCSKRIMTRLGEGIHDNGFIKREAIDKSITALKEFNDIISRYHVYKTSAVATSALREAENSGEFLGKAREIISFEIEVISGEEEAKLSAAGMLIDMAPPETALMVDIGGGSTELIFNARRKPLLIHSFNLGVVYLAGKYMINDPPLSEDLKHMEEEILQKINSTVKPFKKLFTRDTVFIGTAGTITALAAMSQNLTKFDHNKIHNFKLTIDNVKNIFSEISRLSSSERAGHIPFEPARLDIIVPGTLILFKLMEVFGFKEIRVSNYGLREGILINLYNKEAGH